MLSGGEAELRVGPELPAPARRDGPGVVDHRRRFTSQPPYRAGTGDSSPRASPELMPLGSWGDPPSDPEDDRRGPGGTAAVKLKGVVYDAGRAMGARSASWRPTTRPLSCTVSWTSSGSTCTPALSAWAAAIPAACSRPPSTRRPSGRGVDWTRVVECQAAADAAPRHGGCGSVRAALPSLRRAPGLPRPDQPRRAADRARRLGAVRPSRRNAGSADDPPARPPGPPNGDWQ